MRWLGVVAVAAAGSAVIVSAQGDAVRQELARVLENAHRELSGLTVPSADAFSVGDREIAAGSVVNGPIAVAGTLRVAGTIEGDAFSYRGDIVVLDGGHVTGSAIALMGQVRPSGGQVDGEVRAIGGDYTSGAAVVASRGLGDNVALTLGWTAIVLTVGLGLLVFGGDKLDAVGRAVDEQFGRAFLVGVGATIAIAPALVLLVVGLVLTLLGILLVPFAIVAYVLAVIGLVTLGFVAAASVTGSSLVRGNDTLSERGAALRALVTGIAFYFGLWFVAALLTPWPTAASIVRVIAFAATWAAATVGLGATILTRAGTRSSHRPAFEPVVRTPIAPDSPAVPASAPQSQWETPTPVSGVVAARRPTSVK